LFSFRIQRNFKPGNPAPFAYHDTYEYPPNYEPWNFNYEGYGMVLGLFALVSYCKKIKLFLKIVALFFK